MCIIIQLARTSTLKIKIDQLAKVGENDRVKFDFSFFLRRERESFPFFYSFSVVATRGSQRCSSSRGISLRKILFVCIGARIKREELVRV